MVLYLQLTITKTTTVIIIDKKLNFTILTSNGSKETQLRSYQFVKIDGQATCSTIVIFCLVIILTITRAIT